MKTLYVSWMNSTGGISNSEIDIEGKINQYTVIEGVRDSLGQDNQHQLNRIIAWMVVEPYTEEEMVEYWKTTLD